MLQTPLHKFHLDAGGKMVDFAGWDMPIMYAPPGEGAGEGGIHQEHHQVRTSGGFFDVSHMGRVKITGRHARRFLERVCTRRISDMEAGQCRYSLVCNDRGGVRDDVIVYRLDEDDFLVVVNGANREKMLAHFEASRADLALKIDDQTLTTAMVALQGPKVIPMISRISSEIPTLKRYRFTVKNLIIMKLIVSRTGYTGEDGVEVILPASMVGMAMGLLFKDVNMKAADALIKPAGLGARDTLRMEAGMPLYGHELGEDINALECGVDFAISLDKDKADRGEAFLGMEALKRTADSGGPARKLVGIAIQGKRTARQGMPIKSGAQTGIVTSGCLSPTLGHAIAMGFLPVSASEPGAPVSIDTGRGTLEGKIVKLPFYKAPK